VIEGISVAEHLISPNEPSISPSKRSQRELLA